MFKEPRPANDRAQTDQQQRTAIELKTLFRMLSGNKDEVANSETAQPPQREYLPLSQTTSRSQSDTSLMTDILSSPSQGPSRVQTITEALYELDEDNYYEDSSEK